MCSVSYVDFAVRFEDKLTEVNGVPSFRVAKDGRQIYVPAEDFVFIPYMGKTRGESWLATNGDWYLGINANVEMCIRDRYAAQCRVILDLAAQGPCVIVGRCADAILPDAVHLFIYAGMDRQLTFEQALRSREFEPDGPNFTPRISGILHIENGKFNYALSILKSSDGNPQSCHRYTCLLYTSWTAAS